MATIDLTLDSMKVPDINGYTPPFGTKITRTKANKGGLSTVEVNNNVLLPFIQMRPKVCDEDSNTTAVEYDAKIVFNAPAGTTPAAGYTLTMGNGAYIGCTVTYTNLMAYDCTVLQTDGTTTLFTIPAGKTMSSMWTGAAWRWTTSGTVSANDPTPISSAAVHAAISGLNFVKDSYEPTYSELTSSSGWTADHACILCGNIEPDSNSSIVEWALNGIKIAVGGVENARYNSGVCFPVPKNGKVTCEGSSSAHNFFCRTYSFTF